MNPVSTTLFSTNLVSTSDCVDYFTFRINLLPTGTSWTIKCCIVYISPKSVLLSGRFSAVVRDILSDGSRGGKRMYAPPPRIELRCDNAWKGRSNLKYHIYDWKCFRNHLSASETSKFSAGGPPHLPYSLQILCSLPPPKFLDCDWHWTDSSGTKQHIRSQPGITLHNREKLIGLENTYSSRPC